MSWLVWLSELSASLQTKGLPVRFPVKADAWDVGQIPSRGMQVTKSLKHTERYLPQNGFSF